MKAKRKAAKKVTPQQYVLLAARLDRLEGRLRAIEAGKFRERIDGLGERVYGLDDRQNAAEKKLMECARFHNDVKTLHQKLDGFGARVNDVLAAGSRPDETFGPRLRQVEMRLEHKPQTTSMDRRQDVMEALLAKQAAELDALQERVAWLEKPPERRWWQR